LKGNIVQLQIEITSGEEQLRADQAQITQLAEAIKTAKQSPYFMATREDAQFAFVPYDNRAKVSAGTSVFSCWLNMVWCHKVGAVEKSFHDEEHATHPVFKNDIRGSLIQLNLTDNDAAKNTVLFLGRKPLMF
jgi:hypothetical protein